MGSLLLFNVVTIVIGTVFYHLQENLRWIDSLYFSEITLTMVGYGDFSPQTDMGKLFTIVYILNGIGVIFGFINALTNKRLTKRKTVKNDE